MNRKIITAALAALASCTATPALAASCPGEGARVSISPFGYAASAADYAASYAQWNAIIGEVNPAMKGKNPARPPAPGEIERFGSPGLLMATWLVKRGCTLAPLPADPVARDAIEAEAMALMNFEALEYRRGVGVFARRNAAGDPVLLLIMRLLASATSEGAASAPRAVDLSGIEAAAAAMDRAGEGLRAAIAAAKAGR